MYGSVEIDYIATHFALLLGEDSETVQGKFSTLKSYLARRPEAEPWPKTYSVLKVICAANPELMPTQEVLLDIKAVIVWEAVCCERGFSKMKLAKKELQAAMDT